jgi:hypothetical protein
VLVGEIKIDVALVFSEADVDVALGRSSSEDIACPLGAPPVAS